MEQEPSKPQQEPVSNEELLAGETNTPPEKQPPEPPIEPGTASTPEKKKPNWMKIALFSLITLGLAGVIWYVFTVFNTNTDTTTSDKDGVGVRIGLSLDTLAEARWAKDKKYIDDYASSKGAVVTTLIADGEVDVQKEQIENLIAQQVDVILVVPTDSKSLIDEIAKARAAGIKVVSYDRLVLDSEVDVYVTFDNEQVGINSAQYIVDDVLANATTVKKIAYVGGAPTDNNVFFIDKGVMSVLDPLIASGKIELVYSEPTPFWKPDTAYENLKKFLDDGNLVDGVVAANDGTAFGAIRALKDSGIKGIPVSGQDAELAAVIRIIDGTQLMTNYKPLKLLAERAVDIAIALAKGNEVTRTTTINNGLEDIPSVLLSPVPVTKANIDETVIKDGFYTSDEVYGK